MDKKGRAKSAHGKYGPREARISAMITKEGKAGLEALAEKFGVSLNEFLEKLGRREFTVMPRLSGECSAN